MVHKDLKINTYETVNLTCFARVRNCTLSGSKEYRQTLHEHNCRGEYVDATGGCRELCNELLHNLYSVLEINKVTKSVRIE
jgi:hypothetical protein